MFAQTGEFPSHGSIAGASRRLPPVMLQAIVAALLIGGTAYVSSSSDATVPRSETRRLSPIDVGTGVLASFGRRPSHNSRYSAEVVAADPITAGVVQSWIIHLEGRTERRVAHAGVNVEAWMPETGERSPVRPTAHYVGSGNYRVDDLCFSRAGWWNVALVVDGRAGTDSVAFNVVLPGDTDAAARHLGCRVILERSRVKPPIDVP
jgi:hypothetical protein